MIAATTATTTRFDDLFAGFALFTAAGATAFADLGAVDAAAPEVVPRVGTGGITMVAAADFLATFLALFFTALFFATFFAELVLAVVFLTADFFAVFLAALFLTADFFAVFFTADFLAADFLAVVFFTATE